jgi:phage I-like protein
MPIPIPNAEESKDKYISRVMRDESMITEYPDQAQRAAIAYSTWKAYIDEMDAAMPCPCEDEGEDTFTMRYMNHPKMMETYPDESVRMAGCKGQWAKRTAMMDSGVKDEALILLQKSEVEPTDQAQWLLTFPRGKWYIQKLGKELVMDDAFYSQIAKAYDAKTLSKPKIDKDHEFKQSYGDILGYKIDDVGMWFNVKLNDAGIALVKGREYSYISPAWGQAIDTRKQSFPSKLMAISLTNFPAFEGELKPLQDSIQLSKVIPAQPETNGGKTMELTMLAKTLNLQEGATIDSINDAVTALAKSNADLSEKVKADTDTIVKLNQQIADMNKGALEGEAKEAIRKAIELNKIPASVQDMMIERYIQDKAWTVTYLSNIPEARAIEPAKVVTTITLSKKEIEAMKVAGLNPESLDDINLFKGGN